MIYFAQLDSGAIKIGFSDDVGRRMAQLASHYGSEPSVIRTMPGGRDEERELHQKFAHLRFGRTEQFRPAPELLAYIDRPLLVHADPQAIEVVEAASANSRSVRLTEDAIMWAKIAAGYTGETLADYASRVLAERANADIDELHAKFSAPEPPAAPKRPRKGGRDA